MILSIIIAAIFVLACVTLLFHIMHATTQNASGSKVYKGKFTVCIPNLYAVVGVITMLVFGLFIIFSHFIWPNENRYSMIIFYVIFGAFFLLGIYLVIKTIRFRIMVEKDKITVYPLFSRTYMFTFDDINTVVRQTKRQHKGHGERIIIRTKQGKKIIVENSFVAYFKLIDEIQVHVESSRLVGFLQSGDDTKPL